MGKRGPKPTPTKVLELRGSWRAKTRPNEPEIRVERPACPAWLDAPARAMWKKVLAHLAPMDILARVDGYALARYCVLYIRWRAAVEFVTQHGESYPLKDAKGVVRGFALFPQAHLMRALSVELRQYEGAFGMSPSARAAFGMMNRIGKEDGEQETAPKNKRRFFDAG